MPATVCAWSVCQYARRQADNQLQPSLGMIANLKLATQTFYGTLSDAHAKAVTFTMPATAAYNGREQLGQQCGADPRSLITQPYFHSLCADLCRQLQCSGDRRVPQCVIHPVVQRALQQRAGQPQPQCRGRLFNPNRPLRLTKAHIRDQLVKQGLKTEAVLRHLGGLLQPAVTQNFRNQTVQSFAFPVDPPRQAVVFTKALLS